MRHRPDWVPVTDTKEGVSNREMAVAVIADKLGIKPADVTDDTDLEDMGHEITMVLCFKTGKEFIGHSGMKAKDVFAQLS